MHEVSLVRVLLNQVAAVAAEHGGAPVQEFLIEIGSLSGVEPLLVRSAYERLSAGSAGRPARLVINEVPLEAVCEGCDRPFVVDRFRFVCPVCGSGNVRIVRGDECRLVSVTILEPESTQPESIDHVDPSAAFGCNQKIETDVTTDGRTIGRTMWAGR